MTAHVFRGPQEYVFPHQKALDGAPGTLVLTPGKSYDFGTGASGQQVRPIGPAWWWEPQPPEAEAPQPEPAATATPAPLVPLADLYSDGYGAVAAAEG